MIAQVQLPTSAVLPPALDRAHVVRTPEAPFHSHETSEAMLHLLAMELVRHSPVTAQKLAVAGHRKLRGPLR